MTNDFPSTLPFSAGPLDSVGHVLVRPATAADVDGMIALDERVFPLDPWAPDGFRREVASEHTHYVVVARSGGAPAPADAAATPGAGSAATTASGEQAADEILGFAGVMSALGVIDADIQTIAVDERLRRTGLARRMLRELALWAESRGARNLFLEVRANGEAAQRLYDSLGFVEIGRRRGYYRVEGVDAVVMRATTGDVVRHATASLDAAAARREPLVLGIESSCDETGVGIVRGRTLLANAVASSMDQHAIFGGVVPEVAARAHAEAFVPTLERALDEAGVTLDELDAIAVTSGPGLAGALMVGVGAAKGLAAATGKPLYGVNHLVGHVSAELLREPGEERDELEFPAVALLVSGGHTSLIHVRDLVGDVALLGETIDDAAGEAFDKVARLLGLPYPGGPHIDRAAADGDPTAVRFPRGLTRPKDLERHRYDFSFSGLKTAVARHVEALADAGEEIPVADIAASFREAVADVLTAKAVAACRDLDVPRLVLGGGVAANARVRGLAAERCAEAGIELHVPPLRLCTDNGAMIAAVGSLLVQAGRSPSPFDFAADSTLPMDRPQAVAARA